jgi:hypothetical protein
MTKSLLVCMLFSGVAALTWWWWPHTPAEAPRSGLTDSIPFAAPTSRVQPATGRGDRQPAKASVNTQAMDVPVNPHLPAWRKFGDTYKEDFGVVKHRAAVTGNLVDITAALAYQNRCVSRALASAQYYEDGGIKLPELQRKILEAMHARCTDAAGVVNVNVRDSAGFKGNADVLFSAVRGTPIRDPDMRRQVTDFVRETKSASLLEAVGQTVVTDESLAEMGLERSSMFPPHVDRRLAAAAIKLWACEERGDCAGAGNLNPACAAANQCVDDYRDYPSKRLFGDAADRVFDFRSSDNLTPEQIKQRWLLIQQLIRSRYF